MLCSRLRKGRAQVVDVAMPGSLVLKSGLVSSGLLCPVPGEAFTLLPA